jgi:hypothetical protein
MTVHGIVVIDLMILLLLAWVLDQVRRGRLYVGYGIILIIVFLGVALIVSVSPILDAVTWLVGAVFPVSALSLLAFGFIGFLLVYVLTQLSILSRRVTNLVQELAIRQADTTPPAGNTATSGTRPN